MEFRLFTRKFTNILSTVLVFLLLLVSSGLGPFVELAGAAGTWTTKTTGVTNDINGVAYGNGLWIAAGSASELSKSADGGSTWTKQAVVGGTSFYAVVYTGSQWVLVGESGAIFTSTDGTNWTSRSSTTSNTLWGVTSGGGKIVAVGANGTVVTSVDGVTWTSTSLGSSTLYAVKYAGGMFLTSGGAGKLFTSANGTSWTNQATGTANDLNGIAFANGLYVVAGDKILLTSTDGSAWTTRTLPVGASTQTLYGVSYGGNKFVAVGAGDTIVSSTDGVTWSLETSSSAGTTLLGASSGGGKWVTVGTSGFLQTQAMSSNANLSGLTLSAGTLSPVFAAGTTSYTASVSSGTTSVQVTPTIADATATVTVNGAAAISGNASTVSLNPGANPIPVVVTAQDGVTQKTYTVTVTRAVASTNANLSSLTLSAGTLSPAFAAGTTSYTASVGNGVSSVAVTPTVADSTATVKVNGSAATSGSASAIPLNVGSNTITVLVTAQDGSTTKSYTVTVTRAASVNANLSNLTISQGTLSPGFASGTTTYTASVGNSVSSLDVTPTVADSTATVKVNGSAATSGSASSIPLNVGSNTITVLVTAQDGSTQKSYTVTVTRAASVNANLSNLTISQGTLSPGFASGTTSYTASVGNSVSSLDVTPTVADSTATVKVNGSAATSGSASSVPLNVGSNTITVLVTAQDGSTQKSYTVTVTRAASVNANLSNLTISQGTLSPGFASETTTYTASVGNTVTNLTVTPTVADSTATVEVNGVAVTSGNASSPISLNVYENTLSVVVTAQDGSTKQTYTLTVTRAPSSNADLSNLVLSQGTLSPDFVSSTLTYTASVGNAVTNLTVTPTVADSTATVEVNGVAVTSGNASSPISLNVYENTLSVVVTAQDGSTKQTYTLTVTRAPSSNADLSNLALSQGTLSPDFASGTLTYSASVGNAVTNLTLTPTVADSTAIVKVNGVAVTSGNASAPISLTVGENTIKVVVTAQDGSTEQTYTLTVTRAPSSNTDLSNLELSQGTLSPDFASGTLTYTASVGNAVTDLTVTPTVADSTATVEVNGVAVTSGNASTPISLNVYENTISVVVTAQDGSTKKTYILTVTRAPSSNADLNNLALSQGTLSPDFASGTLTYTASVGNAVTDLTVTPTVADSTATIEVNGVPVTSGNASAPISLTVGENTIIVVVTAQDGSTEQTYTLTVTRAASSNNDLSNLTLSQGALSPVFSSGTTSYTASVSTAVNRVNITPTVSDSTATVKIGGVAITSGTPREMTLNIGANPIKIEVSAQDGTTKTYTVTISREPGTGTGGGGGGGTHHGPVKIEVDNGPGTPPGTSFNDVTKLLGSQVKMSAEILSSTGQKLNLPVIPIIDDSFQLSGVQAGNYQLVLNVLAPNGEKLAGQKATLIVASDGSATIKTELIDPYGTVRDSITHQPIAGVTTTLYWADTELNRAKGRTPGTAVTLPELPSLTPNQNHNPQITTDSGQYGWMVFPDGDYYTIAERDGYVVFDSRNDPREELHGDSSYIRNGLIHVGQTTVQMNYNMQAKVVSSGVHNPYIYGYSDGTFGPDQHITRAELAAILSRTLPDGTNSAAAPSFHDLQASHWAYSSIAKVCGLKIMVGNPDGTFHPDDIVTRAEMAVVIARLKQLPTALDTDFTDIGGHWAQPFIAQAEHGGYLNGYPDHTYHPDQTITRAETVVVINKLLDRNVQQVSGLPKWSDVSPDFWGFRAIMEASLLHAYDLLSNGVEIWKP
ncbi:cadherin-like beta sandwich domain-containing protein [Tumebacillus permanentifrigoris]|uniref:Photosystem II stability/assembly factor-like uncharacterized protein n=1 Tax=Tumebacillus permanentifrigoris TaxID=378543 RepID=A0A316DAQ7_9BACL|nr:cadherin-like beta sandwich domain-containing protein [Tumebacillus permanentifrigoris]PWK13487.1 photosystem II stability/assembly factor-like uncharacterized protein [Tumebacillus permanentifrigoris]